MHQCWICYDTEGDDFISPCRCSGSTKFVHTTCLASWIEIHQRNSPTATPVCCPQCKFEYKVVYSKVPQLYRIYGTVYLEGRRLWRVLVFYSGLTGILCGGYILSSFYGFFSWVFVYGPEETASIMSSIDLLPTERLSYPFSPRELLVMFPFIPVYLISPNTTFFIGSAIFLIKKSNSAKLLVGLSLVSIGYTSLKSLLFSKLSRLQASSSAPNTRPRVTTGDSPSEESDGSLSESSSSTTSLDEPGVFLESEGSITTGRMNLGTIFESLLIPFVSAAFGSLIFYSFKLPKLHKSIFAGFLFIISRDTALATFSYFGYRSRTKVQRILQFYEASP